MKNIVKYIFLIIITMSIGRISVGQEVDEIIAKHIKAHGGAEKWDKVESMKITGKFTAFSEENDFQAIKTRNGEYYSELSLGQHDVVEAFNGTKGWTIDPWHEILFPRELKKPEINVFHQKAEFFTPFYKYKEKGITVELLGKQNVDGVDVYAIKLTKKDGNTETWYLDANTYLEYKCESNWVDFTYPAPAESYFEDFQTVDGLVIPFYIERTFYQRDRILLIDNIEVNPEIDKSIFNMPRSSDIQELGFLEGEWDVKVEIMTRRGTWYNLDNTTSSISYAATNILRETITYDLNFVQSKIINYTYDSELEEYLVSVYNNYSSGINVFTGDFTDTTFVVVSKKLDCTDTTQGSVLSQIVLSAMEENSFLLEINSSNDDGVTWGPQQKLSYTRKNEE